MSRPRVAPAASKIHSNPSRMRLRVFFDLRFFSPPSLRVVSLSFCMTSRAFFIFLPCLFITIILSLRLSWLSYYQSRSIQHQTCGHDGQIPEEGKVIPVC